MCIRDRKWTTRSSGRSSFLYVDGHILNLVEDGTLELIEATPEKYEPVATMTIDSLGSPAWSAPVLSHGLLYLRGSKTLACFELIR